MTLNELSAHTAWRRSGCLDDQVITGLFVGDLLSYVMGHALEGQIWVTMQNHINSIGVANLKELSAIVLIDGLSFDEDLVEKAKANHIALFTSPVNAVDTLRTLIALGL